MSNTSTTLLGLLVGSIIGATAGILLAPDSGINTRKKIHDGAHQAKENITRKASELKHHIANQAIDKKHNLDDQLETVVSNFSHKTEDVITSLEAKLAQLKMKNKKLQKTS